MTDSPIVRAPLDPKEEPILQQLLLIRDHLELMKQDKSCFLKADKVSSLYQEVILQVHALNSIRATKREEQNRVDTVLDDCLQLISLAFMTIGKNSEAPAIYSIVSTIKRLLDHVKEAAFYSSKDLEDVSRNLAKFRETIAREKDNNDPQIVTLLNTRLDICDLRVKELNEVISAIPPELVPINDKLVSILRSLSACNVKSKYPKSEMDELNAQLQDVQEKLQLTGLCPVSLDALIKKYEEKLENAKDGPPGDGRQYVVDLLIRCLIWSRIIQERPCKIKEGFEAQFEKLQVIRNQLESRQLLQAWSLRETDLYSYQRQLDRIDESRNLDGYFTDSQGNRADLQTERTLLYLLRKSYALIYMLLTRSEPVSEALLPIYNQLKTLRNCLKEVQKAGGVSSSRELYPYSMKLASIDNLRVDGKFMVNNGIPEGQGSVMTLLEECFDITHQLSIQADQEESGNGN